MKIEYIIDNSGVSKGYKRELPDNLAKALIAAGIVKEVVVKEEKIEQKESKLDIQVKEYRFDKKTKSKK